VTREGRAAAKWAGQNVGVWLSWRDGVLGRAGLRAAAAAAATVALGGCGLLAGRTALQHDDPQTMTVTSPEFGQGRAIPRQFTCRRGESPPLNWSGVPSGTRSLALVVDDAAAPITPYVYWIVFNINPKITDIQANRLPLGAMQGANSKGTVGYAAPCPSRSHEYRFTIYAVNASLALPEGASLTALTSDIAGHALARGRLTGIITP
jgi:Raf kinase inhibitor-like YbhB/YbcL family protein